MTVSYGIILITNNNVLLVKKTNTYGFLSIVQKGLINDYILSEMNLREYKILLKHIVVTDDRTLIESVHKKLWKTIRRTNNIDDELHTPRYINALKLFTENYEHIVKELIKPEAINRVKYNSFWDVPKGLPSHRDGNIYMTAKREFREETKSLINTKNFPLLDNATKIKVLRFSPGENKYYEYCLFVLKTTSLILNSLPKKVKFNSRETCQIQFFPINKACKMLANFCNPELAKGLEQLQITCY